MNCWRRPAPFRWGRTMTRSMPSARPCSGGSGSGSVQRRSPSPRPQGAPSPPSGRMPGSGSGSRRNDERDTGDRPASSLAVYAIAAARMARHGGPGVARLCRHPGLQGFGVAGRRLMLAAFQAGVVGFRAPWPIEPRDGARRGLQCRVRQRDGGMGAGVPPRSDRPPGWGSGRGGSRSRGWPLVCFTGR